MSEILLNNVLKKIWYIINVVIINRIINISIQIKNKFFYIFLVILSTK